ncbi:cation transporting ATPase C-terminal domain-containing protein [Sphingobacterium multivorum]|uniref:cation transporting ATPase C-terminal domain-containing protein n=1 Tax=Sphingobacterium multivorum TaxID=28454 RepID=UPI0028AF442F|nr:cation transporting ATPase C-terminal domain-containing protein [Sphingobacterium multivorum]
MESVVSATLIVLVVRTRQSFIISRPGKYLLLATLFIAVLALFLPILPFTATMFGFIILPLRIYLAMLGIVVIYILSAELMKRWFYKHFA